MRLVAMLVMIGAGVAAAEPAGPNPDDKARADELFQLGRDKLGKGDRVAACKLFDESFAKDPRAVGTMLNLGLCREEGGAVASAVRFYAEARDRAHDQNLAEHQEAAERKLAMLAPRIPHLQIVLPADIPNGVRILVDDLVLARDQLVDLPVDPGKRAIIVTAPGKVPYETTVEIKEGEHQKLVVPSLTGATTKTVVIESSSRRSYGKIGVFGGAALGLAGIGLGLWGRHLYWAQFPQGAQDATDSKDLKHDCFIAAGVRHCDVLGTTKLRTSAIVSGIGTGVGIASIVAMGVGAYLWIFAPSNVAVDVGREHATVSATIHF